MASVPASSASVFRPSQLKPVSPRALAKWVEKLASEPLPDALPTFLFCDPAAHGADSPPWTSSEVSGHRPKVLYLMRHGEGTHNQAARERGYDAYGDPAHFDASLNALGQQQAERGFGGRRIDS